MSLRVITGNGNSTMTENDRMLVFILAKCRIIESSLSTLLNRSDHHDSSKKLVEKIIEIYTNRPDEISDEEFAIAQQGYKETFRAIFGKDLSMK